MKLKGKVAILTGGGQGIGEGIAIQLAKEGARVVVSDINQVNIDKVVKEIKNMGSEAIGVKTDASKAEEVNQLVRETVEKFGRVDILVNNAGICNTYEITEMKEDEWDQKIDVNLKSAFLCSKAVMPKMIEQKYGKIVNIASVSAICAWPKMCHYAASKAGMIGFTNSLAFDVSGHGINVNVIAPGAIQTPLLNSIEMQLGMTKEQIIESIPIGRLEGVLKLVEI